VNFQSNDGLIFIVNGFAHVGEKGRTFPVGKEVTNLRKIQGRIHPLITGYTGRNAEREGSFGKINRGRVGFEL